LILFLLEKFETVSVKHYAKTSASAGMTSL